LGDALDDETRAQMINILHEYTGLDPKLIDEQDLRISPQLFATHLLPGKVISVVDSRLAFDADTQIRIDPALDQWEKSHRDAMLAAIGLGAAPPQFASNEYTGIIQVGQHWDFGNGVWAQRRVHEAMEALLRLKPNLPIADISGMYDLIRPAPLSNVFWQEMLQRAPIRLRRFGPDRMPPYNSFFNEPGVEQLQLRMGHQLNGLKNRERRVIGHMLSSLALASSCHKY
jgi:hypothetical protein